MSFAVIQTGGKQYKVKAGEIIKIEKLENSKAETKVEFKEILAYGDEKNLELGEPTISGAKVEADLIKNAKKDAIFLHCLPRGNEVSENVFLGKQSRVWQQALNRVHVQKSILLYCFGKLR